MRLSYLSLFLLLFALCWSPAELDAQRRKKKRDRQEQKNPYAGRYAEQISDDETVTAETYRFVHSRRGGMMPAWHPGLQDGEPVRVQFNLPVRFKLE